jgi:hypothetical protein
MPHSFLPMAFIKPTTQTGHRLSPVSALDQILDHPFITGALSHWAAIQLLSEIRHVTGPSFVADQDKRHLGTSVHQAAIRAVQVRVVNSAIAIWHHLSRLVYRISNVPTQREREIKNHAQPIE